MRMRATPPSKFVQGGLLLLLFISIVAPSDCFGRGEEESADADKIFGVGVRSLAPEVRRITMVPTPGQEVRVQASDSNLTIFCVIGEKKYVSSFFKTAKLQVRTDDSRVPLKWKEGPHPSSILEEDKNSSFLVGLFNSTPVWKVKECSFCRQDVPVTWTFSLPPFETSCVGIEFEKDYTATLIVHSYDPWSVTLFSVGIFFLRSSLLFMLDIFFFFFGGIGPFYFAWLLAAIFFPFLTTAFALTVHLPQGNQDLLTLSILIWAGAGYATYVFPDYLEVIVESEMGHWLLLLYFVVIFVCLVSYYVFLVFILFGVLGRGFGPNPFDMIQSVRMFFVLLGSICVFFSSEYWEMCRMGAVLAPLLL